MFIRYRQEADGSRLPVAEIYSKTEHGIDLREIDLDAVWAIRKLKQTGADAYIVGGAVRDLLIGRKPKDFDIATSASPRQIQKLFWNARIIGKRFKLVHLTFRDKILEVSTFRSGEEGAESGPAMYGTIEQDAKRRDFTLNALYLDPIEGTLLDFNHSMEDVRKKRIRSILPLSTTFVEDPVRMVRAVKYAATAGFTIPLELRWAIKRNAKELARVSSSRLTEEVSKILASGEAAAIIRDLQKYRLLVYMLPCLSVYTRFPEIDVSLRHLDEKTHLASKSSAEKTEVTKGEMLQALTRPMIVFDAVRDAAPEEVFRDIFRQIKVLVSPMTPPNHDVEQAVAIMMKESGLSVPRSCLRTAKPGTKAPFNRPDNVTKIRRDAKTGEAVQDEPHKKAKRRRKKKRPSAAQAGPAPSATV